MKVTVLYYSDEALGRMGCKQSISIEVDGVYKFEVGEGEPEDATLGRDYRDCWAIPDLMELAYQAGKKGEDFSVEHQELEADG